MKRLSAIILLNLFLLKILAPATDTFELAKVPLLVQHFIEHREASPGLSLWAFLMLHYENPQHHQEDHQTHSDLPFGGHHHENCQVQVWFMHPLEEFVLDRHELSSISIGQYTHQTGSSFLNAIWQPPRHS